MTSNRYDSIKYVYTTDLGQQKIKRQRAYYLGEGSNKEYTTPLTNLFFARQVTGNGRVVGSSSGTRRALVQVKVEVNQIQRTVNLPYAPLDSLLNQQLLEILNVQGNYPVLCLQYSGESPVES